MQYNFRWDVFWEHVRGARATRRLTHAQVGKEVGVGGSRFSQLESKSKPVSAEKFLILCAGLDLEPMMYLEVIHEETDLIQKQLIHVPVETRWEMNHKYEWVYRTPEEEARFEQLDLEADVPVGYHREQADLYDYYKLDREMGY